MLKPLMTPLEQEIDTALQVNWTALLESLCDLLAAVVLCTIALVSVLHGLARVVFAVLGLLLWALALLITGLYWVRAWAVSRSASSIHRR